MKIHFTSALVDTGWAANVLITISGGGVIESIEADMEIPEDAQVIEGICLPGVPNLHSHAFQRAMAGLTEIAGSGENNFWTWQKVMYDFLDRLEPEDVEAIAAQLYIEMLKSGYTSVAEFHYLHHGRNGAPYDNADEMSLRIIEGAAAAGIGITHLPVLYAHGGFAETSPLPGQRRFLHTTDQYADLIEALRSRFKDAENVEIGIAFHSLRAVSPVMIGEILKLAGSFEDTVPIHIHISEQMREVEQCVEWSGKRPIEWLLNHTDVNERWCLIHATHMTEEETRSLAQSGAVAGLCPTTEANLGDGLFPLEAYLRENGGIGIGSDSNTSVDAAEELRLLEYGQRLHLQRRNVSALAEGASTGASLLDSTLAGGAQALGQPVGRLAPGRRADMIVLDQDHPTLAGRARDTAIDTWVFSGGRNVISDVFIGGRHLVKDSRHENQDIVSARYRNVIIRLMSDY